MALTQKYASTFKIFSDPARETLTHSFKSTGRSQKHQFERRMVKDFNNLDYGIHDKYSFVNQLKKSSHRKKQPNLSPKKKKSDNPEIIEFTINRSHPIVPRNNSMPGISPMHYDKITQMQKSQNLLQTKNSLSLSKELRSTSSGFLKPNRLSNDFGLSKFEHQETILGKIQKRPSHHLNFSKKPERPQNINKVWYSKQEKLSALDADRYSKLHQIHSFKSNRPHNSFVPADNLDKIYDYQPGYDLIKPRPDISIKKLEGFSARPDLPRKQGTQLEYPKNRSLLNKKKPMFQISKSQRKLKINRQVIDPVRACYR